MRWIRFTAALLGSKSEKSADGRRYVMDSCLQGVGAGKVAACILSGLDEATLTGASRKMLLGSWERLREPDSIVIDNAGYILLFPDEPLELDRELEMNDHKVKIVGISDASAPFLSNPVIHTRYSEAV